jgi:hypothetical protein
MSVRDTAFFQSFLLFLWSPALSAAVQKPRNPGFEGRVWQYHA